jgi:hypothetical protein
VLRRNFVSIRVFLHLLCSSELLPAENMSHVHGKTDSFYIRDFEKK